MTRSLTPNVRPNASRNDSLASRYPLPGAADSGRIRRDAGAMFVLALVIRVAYVLYAQAADPFFAWVEKGFDSDVFRAWASEILAGDPLLRSAGLFYHSPLAAYFWAAVYSIFGQQNYFALHLVQALLGAATCALFIVVANTWLSRTWAWAAALCFCFAAPVLYYEQTLLNEGQVLAAYVVLLWGLRTGELALQADAGDGAVARAGWQRPALRFAIAGVAGAIAMIGRGNALAVVLVCMAWCLWAAHGRQIAAGNPPARWSGLNWRAAGFFVLGFMLVAGPLVWRNHEVAGRVTLGMTNGKVMFYMGNAADASGRFEQSARYQQASAKAQQDPDSYRKMFFEDLRDAPGAVLFNFARKAYYFLAATDLPDNVNFQLAREILVPLRWTPVQWEWLAPLGLVGLALCGAGTLRERRWTLLWTFALTFAVSIILIIPIGRYRLPMVIVWSLAAGAALEWAAISWSTGHRRRIAAAVAALVSGALALWPWPNASAPDGRLIRATDFKNGLLAAVQSDNGAALEQIIPLATRAAPEMATLWVAFRVDFAERSSDPAALRRAVTALERARDESGGLHLLGAERLMRSYLQLGELDRAREILVQLQTEFPGDPDLAKIEARLSR